IADTARKELERLGPLPDDTWREIWDRQTTKLWEIFWAAASLKGRSYEKAYEEADRVLTGVKRTRIFEQAEERGLKDSLSGRREALHTRDRSAKDYWKAIAGKVPAAKLRREGRERLDAIGAVKRFSDLAERGRFPSTSTIASKEFLNNAKEQLKRYREAVEELLGAYLYRIQSHDSEWPYDGDLLYLETLAENRLLDSYGMKKPGPALLEKARCELRSVYELKMRPSPYYGLIVMDGDDMGERINRCIKEENPEEAHRRLSRSLLDFSRCVPDIVKEYGASLVYNGGDDVVVLVQLSETLPLAQALVERFEAVTRGTASAGVAIAHHLYPLDAVVRAARDAEAQAKKVEGKASVCVTVLKRSGVMTMMRSRWRDFHPVFNQLVNLFKEEDTLKAALAARFAYDVAQAANGLPQADEKLRAELKRLLTRHRNNHHPKFESEEWTERLYQWAATLPEEAEELGRWLILARFIARGGAEE
ncbi:MAG: type III-B CRISPR-associated protein Cas10/Cmr2, partial [Bacillota bacterium]